MRILLVEDERSAARIIAKDATPNMDMRSTWLAVLDRQGRPRGLGLPIARWIAREHGATLTVEGGRRGGSVFTFHIAAEATTSAREAAEVAANARLHPV